MLFNKSVEKKLARQHQLTIDNSNKKNYYPAVVDSNRMTLYSRWLLLMLGLTIIEAVVLPRPPSPREEVVTSSELPKQIPAPPPPPAHSSTPQYHVEDQPTGLKLLWISKNNSNNKRKHFIHRTDLMPNMI